MTWTFVSVLMIAFGTDIWAEEDVKSRSAGMDLLIRTPNNSVVIDFLQESHNFTSIPTNCSYTSSRGYNFCTKGTHKLKLKFKRDENPTLAFLFSDTNVEIYQDFRDYVQKQSNNSLCSSMRVQERNDTQYGFDPSDRITACVPISPRQLSTGIKCQDIFQQQKECKFKHILVFRHYGQPRNHEDAMCELVPTCSEILDDRQNIVRILAFLESQINRPTGTLFPMNYTSSSVIPIDVVTTPKGGMSFSRTVPAYIVVPTFAAVVLLAAIVITILACKLKKRNGNVVSEMDYSTPIPGHVTLDDKRDIDNHIYEAIPPITQPCNIIGENDYHVIPYTQNQHQEPKTSSRDDDKTYDYAVTGDFLHILSSADQKNKYHTCSPPSSRLEVSTDRLLVDNNRTSIQAAEFDSSPKYYCLEDPNSRDSILSSDSSVQSEKIVATANDTRMDIQAMSHGNQRKCDIQMDNEPDEVEMFDNEAYVM